MDPQPGIWQHRKLGAHSRAVVVIEGGESGILENDN